MDKATLKKRMREDRYLTRAITKVKIGETELTSQFFYAKLHVNVCNVYGNPYDTKKKIQSMTMSNTGDCSVGNAVANKDYFSKIYTTTTALILVFESIRVKSLRFTSISGLCVHNDNVFIMAYNAPYQR